MSTDSAAQQRATGTVSIRRILEQIFRNYTGSLGIHLWNGDTFTVGRPHPSVSIVFNSPRALSRLILRQDLLHLAESYLHGDIDLEGDLNALFAQRDHLEKLKYSMSDRVNLMLAAMSIGNNSAAEVKDPQRFRSAPQHLLGLRKHSRNRDRNAIAFHYDKSNDFYRLWLDDQMVYSCAYFKQAGDNIHQAQANKLDHICRKLRLRSGETLLDIGCGWGALICWAARHYRVTAHGITLSQQQHDYAQQKIQELRLQDQVSVELRDYRDLSANQQFDKVCSVGMFEHVGIKHLPEYFQCVQRELKPGGLFLNHGITNDEEGWHPTVGTRFIQRYVFPDSELETISNVQRVMEHNRFEIWDVEALRPHYAMTLRHWLSRLEAHHEQAVALIGEVAYRIWRLYIAVSAAQFDRGSIGVYQILAINGRGQLHGLPLTREDIYHD